VQNHANHYKHTGTGSDLLLLDEEMQASLRLTFSQSYTQRSEAVGRQTDHKELPGRTRRTNKSQRCDGPARARGVPTCFSPLFAGWVPRKGGGRQGEGVAVCKNCLVGLNGVGLSSLEEMPERQCDRGT